MGGSISGELGLTILALLEEEDTTPLQETLMDSEMGNGKAEGQHKIKQQHSTTRGNKNKTKDKRAIGEPK